MTIPEPGTYVRVYYVRPKRGGIVGEEGEIVSVSSDAIRLESQPKRRENEDKNPPIVKSTVQKHDIMRVERVNAS